jgi:hypothetical protein
MTTRRGRQTLALARLPSALDHCISGTDFQHFAVGRPADPQCGPERSDIPLLVGLRTAGTAWLGELATTPCAVVRAMTTLQPATGMISSKRETAAISLAAMRVTTSSRAKPATTASIVKMATTYSTADSTWIRARAERESTRPLARVKPSPECPRAQR